MFGSLVRPLSVAMLGACLSAAAAQGAIIENDYSLVLSAPGNDCSGALGTPPDCAWDGSPMLVKLEFSNGSVTGGELGNFPSIDGTEFTFDFSSGFKWTYTPDDATDPGVTAFSVKGGPTGYTVWEKGSAAYLGIGDYSDTWTTWNGTIGGLSHIVFYDLTTPIPLPAAAWLMLGAFGGLGLMARRRKAA